MKLYTIDNLDAVGTHSMTFPTDSIVYIGIKTDLQFPTYFNFHELELADVTTGRALKGTPELPKYQTAIWFKNYVVGHLWTGSEPFNGTVSHELSGYVPVYEPTEKEVDRFSFTLSGDTEEENRTFIYDTTSVFTFDEVGGTVNGLVLRDENLNPLGYACYMATQNTLVKKGKRIITTAFYSLIDITKIKFANDVQIPDGATLVYKSVGGYVAFNNDEISATSLGTVTIDDWPVKEYVPATPKKIDLRIKVEEKSYAYIYHPAVNEGN